MDIWGEILAHDFSRKVKPYEVCAFYTHFSILSQFFSALRWTWLCSAFWWSLDLVYWSVYSHCLIYMDKFRWTQFFSRCSLLVFSDDFSIHFHNVAFLPFYFYFFLVSIRFTMQSWLTEFLPFNFRRISISSFSACQNSRVEPNSPALFFDSGLMIIGLF